MKSGAEKYNAKLIFKDEILPGLLYIKYDLGQEFDALEGQFVNIGVTEPFKRPYSIFESEGSILTFLISIRLPGKGSDYFRNALLGSTTTIFGPLGHFGRDLVENSLTGNLVFISAGTGFVPFLSMINKIQKVANTQIKLFHGSRFENEDIANYFFDKFINNSQIKYTPCISREAHSQTNKQMRVLEAIETDTTISYKNDVFYICGANEMVSDMRKLLRSKNATKIYVENYG